MEAFIQNVYKFGVKQVYVIFCEINLVLSTLAIFEPILMKFSQVIRLT